VRKDPNLSQLVNKYLDELIVIDCPLCRRNETLQVGWNSRGGITISTVICKGCGLIYLNPKPSAGKYSDFYASGDYRRFLDIVKGRGVASNIGGFSTDEKFEKRKIDGRQIAQRYFRDIVGKGDLYFDFGCNLGGFMAGVKEVTGCELMGNEPFELCAEYIKKKMGISILNSTMEQICKEDRQKYKGRAKVVSITAALEHVNDPVSCLQIAHQMLVDQGYLYVESFDIFRRMETKTESVGDVATIDHQYYYYKQVYSFLLQNCHFEVLDYNASNGNMMQVLAQKRKSDTLPKMNYDPNDMIRKVLRLNKQAAEYHNSVTFKLKEIKNRSIRESRRLGKVLVGRLMHRWS